MMTKEQLDNDIRNQILNFQKNEITEYHIYSKLSKRVKDEHNIKTLRKIGKEEKEHYDFWR